MGSNPTRSVLLDSSDWVCGNRALSITGKKTHMAQLQTRILSLDVSIQFVML